MKTLQTSLSAIFDVENIHRKIRQLDSLYKYPTVRNTIRIGKIEKEFKLVLRDAK
jgi:hypothetical protein